MSRTNKLVPVPLDILRRVYINYNKIMIAKDYYDFALDSLYVLDTLLSDPQRGISIYRLKDPEKQKMGVIKSHNFNDDVVTRGVQYFMRDEEIHVPLHVKELEGIYNFGIRKLINYRHCEESWLKSNFRKSDVQKSRLRFYFYFNTNVWWNHVEVVIFFYYTTLEEEDRIIREFNEGYFPREKYVVSRTKKDN